MAVYQTFTTLRTTLPDFASLVAAVRAATDSSAGCYEINPGQWRVKKATAFSSAELTACQSAIDTAPAASLRLTAQADIDHWPIETRALLLTLLDQINVLRTAAGMATVTPAQALNAVRNKANTL